MYLVYTICNYKTHTYDKKRKYVVGVNSLSFFSFNFKDYDEDFSLLRHIMTAYVLNSGKLNPLKQQEYIYFPCVEKCSLGLIYILNNYQQSYVLEGPHDLVVCRDITQEYPEDVSLPLPGNGGVAMVITTRDEYYVHYSCGGSKYKLIPQDCETYETDISRFLESSSVADMTNEDYYSWFHKNYKLDMSKVAEKLDASEIMKN